MLNHLVADIDGLFFLISVFVSGLNFFGFDTMLQLILSLLAKALLNTSFVLIECSSNSRICRNRSTIAPTHDNMRADHTAKTAANENSSRSIKLCRFYRGLNINGGLILTSILFGVGFSLFDLQSAILKTVNLLKVITRSLKHVLHFESSFAGLNSASDDRHSADSNKDFRGMLSRLESDFVCKPRSGFESRSHIELHNIKAPFLEFDRIGKRNVVSIYDFFLSANIGGATRCDFLFNRSDRRAVKILPTNFCVAVI